MIYHDRELREILSRQKRFITKVVIDEAHMVVLWGEDFRIDFGKLDFLTCLFLNAVQSSRRRQQWSRSFIMVSH